MRWLFLVLVFGGVLAVARAYSAADFNVASRSHEPPPSGHEVGKDNAPGTGLHNAGEDCGICHTPGGKAANYVFTMAGTIYADRAARRPLANAEVILEDSAGKVLSMTTNQVGNFWTYSPISSYPLTVASHGGVTELLYGYDAQGNLIPADPKDSRTWLYKAWIRNGSSVRHMNTISPVGGATGTTPRMSCNMHHSPLGSSGAAWSSSKAVLPSYPAANLSFKKHIQPIVIAKCVPCHIPGATSTRATTASDLDPSSPTTIDYSGGKDFTSYDGSSYVVGATTINKGGVRSAVDPSAPDASPLLQRTLVQPDGSVIHGGGAFWSATDPDYQALRQWIAEGAQNN